jgi:hypothetical protein
MKFVLVLLVSEADAEFAKVKEPAQEEQPAPLIRTPGRPEK